LVLDLLINSKCDTLLSMNPHFWRPLLRLRIEICSRRRLKIASYGGHYAISNLKPDFPLLICLSTKLIHAMSLINYSYFSSVLSCSHRLLSSCNILGGWTSFIIRWKICLVATISIEINRDGRQHDTNTLDYKIRGLHSPKPNEEALRTKNRILLETSATKYSCNNHKFVRIVDTLQQGC